MFKYVLKRIGYMFLVLFILSIVIFMIYNLTPSNRAYTDAKADQAAMKQQLAGMSAEAQAKWFEERYEMYQISYGTETNNMILRYLRWVGLYPYADNPYTGKEGKLNGLLQGNFGYSYQYKKNVVNVVTAPMKNTIFINIFATILALAITIPLGIACAVRKNSKFDRFTQVFTIIGYSLPSFIICILFIWVFCALLGWFPASGTGQQLRGLQVVHRPHVLSGPPAHHHDVLLSGQHDALRPCLHDRCSVHGLHPYRARQGRQGKDRYLFSRMAQRPDPHRYDDRRLVHQHLCGLPDL